MAWLSVARKTSRSGLQRLAKAATPGDRPLDVLLTEILADLTHEQSEDDTANSGLPVDPVAHSGAKFRM